MRCLSLQYQALLIMWSLSWSQNNDSGWKALGGGSRKGKPQFINAGQGSLLSGGEPVLPVCGRRHLPVRTQHWKYRITVYRCDCAGQTQQNCICNRWSVICFVYSAMLFLIGDTICSSHQDRHLFPQSSGGWSKEDHRPTTRADRECMLTFGEHMKNTKDIKTKWKKKDQTISWFNTVFICFEGVERSRKTYLVLLRVLYQLLKIMLSCEYINRLFINMYQYIPVSQIII